MNLASTILLYFGGPGSGCQGPNCGRPSTGIVRNSSAFKPPPPVSMKSQQMDHYVVGEDGTAKRVLSHISYFLEEKKKLSEFLRNGGIMATVSGGGPGVTFGSKDESTVEKVIQVISHPAFSGYETTVSYFGKSTNVPEMEFEGRPGMVARQMRAWLSQQRAA